MSPTKTESGTVRKSQSKEKAPLIFQKIANIMKKVEAITKDRENVQQRYQFRGIDDVYNSLHDMLADEEVFTVPEVLEERHDERQAKSGSALIYAVLKVQYKFMTVDASFIPVTVIGEGMDSGDKASNKAMAAAHKYALLQLFLIPTGDAKDSEEDSHDVAPRSKNNDEFWGTVGERSGDEAPRTVKKVKFQKGKKIFTLSFYEALDLFKKAKEEFIALVGEMNGKKVYYTILGEAGFEKSNQIPLEQMPKVYSAMIENYKAMLEDKKKAEEDREESALGGE